MDRHKLEPPFDFGSLFQDALKHDNSILLDLLKENEDGFKSLLKNYLKDGDNWNHFLGQNVAKYARCPPPSNVVVAAGVDDTVLTLLSQMGSVDEQFLQAIQTVTDPFIEKKTKNLPSGVQGTNQGTSFTAAGGGGKSSNDSLKTVDDDATVHGPGSSLDIENNTNNNTNNSYNFSTMEGNEAGLGDASLDNASRLSSLNDAAPVSMAMDENTVEDSTERPRTPTGLLSALPAIAISNTTTAAESAATVHFGSPCTQDSTAVGAVTPRTPTTPSGTERDLLGCCCGGAGDRSINKRAAFHNTVRCILDHQPSLLATLKSIQTTATGSDSLSTNKDTNSKDGNNKTNEDSTVEYDADVAASAGKIAELLNALNARKKEQARDETQICGDGSRGRDTGGLQLKDDSSDATVKLGKRGRYCLDIWEEEEFIARTRSKTHTQLRPLYDWGDLFHSHAYDENHDGFYRDWLVSQQVEAKSEIRQKGTMTKRKKSAIDPIFKSVAPEVDTSSLASIKPPPVPVAIHHPACWGILHNDNSDRNQSRQTSASYRHPASLSRRVYSTNSTTNGAVIDAATATATATASAAATNSMPSGLHVHEKGSEAVPVSKRVSFSSLSNATNSTTTNTRTGSAPRRATTNNKADATTTATNTNNTSTNTTINRANLSPGSDGGSDIGETLDAMEEIEDVDDFNLYADTLAQQLLVEEANNFVRLTLLQQALATHRQSMKLSARRKRLEELFYQAVLKASMQNPYPLNPKKDNFIQRNNRLSDTSSFQRKQKNSSGVVQSIATVSGSARTTQFSLNNDSNSNNTNHLMSAPGDVSAGRYNTRCGISSGGVRANGKEELVAAAASRGWSRKHDLLGACAMQQVPHGALLPESVQAGEEVEVLVGKHWRVGLVRRLLTDGGLIRHVKVELLDELDAAEEEQNKAALKAVLQPSTSLPLDDSAADVDLGSAGAAESEVAAAPPPLPTPTTTTPTPTPLAEKQKIEYRSAPSVWVAIEDGRLAPYGTNLRKKRPTTTTTTMTMTQQKQQQQQQQQLLPTTLYTGENGANGSKANITAAATTNTNTSTADGCSMTTTCTELQKRQIEALWRHMQENQQQAIHPSDQSTSINVASAVRGDAASSASSVSMEYDYFAVPAVAATITIPTDPRRSRLAASAAASGTSGTSGASVATTGVLFPRAAGAGAGTVGGINPSTKVGRRSSSSSSSSSRMTTIEIMQQQLRSQRSSRPQALVNATDPRLNAASMADPSNQAAVALGVLSAAMAVAAPQPPVHMMPTNTKKNTNSNMNSNMNTLTSVTTSRTPSVLLSAVEHDFPLPHPPALPSIPLAYFAPPPPPPPQQQQGLAGSAAGMTATAAQFSSSLLPDVATAVANAQVANATPRQHKPDNSAAEKTFRLGERGKVTKN